MKKHQNIVSPDIFSESVMFTLAEAILAALNKGLKVFVYADPKTRVKFNEEIQKYLGTAPVKKVHVVPLPNSQRLALNAGRGMTAALGVFIDEQSRFFPTIAATIKASGSNRTVFIGKAY